MPLKLAITQQKQKEKNGWQANSYFEKKILKPYCILAFND